MLNIFSIRNLSQSSWKGILFLLLSFCFPSQLLPSPCVLLPCLVEYIELLASFEKTSFEEELADPLEINEEQTQFVLEQEESDLLVLEQEESDRLIKESKTFQEESQRSDKENFSSENQLPEEEKLSIDFSSEKEANFFDHIFINKVESETDLLKWCKKTALLEKALIVVIDSPKEYFKGLSSEGKRYLEKRCCLVQSTALVISQTCRIDSSFPITGIMIFSQFNEKVDGIFIDWMMIYPGQKILINLMNEEVNPSFFFHCLKKYKK